MIFFRRSRPNPLLPLIESMVRNADLDANRNARWHD